MATANYIFLLDSTRFSPASLLLRIFFAVETIKFKHQEAQ